ncbi:MAG: hypothetical protein RL514_4745 [Verrucomicrobiota bacterium]
MDKRSLAELQEQARDALNQIQIRAHCGDQNAMRAFGLTLRDAVGELESLANHQPEATRAVAEVCRRWPVLLSLNPQDIAHAKEHLVKLNAGAKAVTPTRTGQRVDSLDPWTSIARGALDTCRLNKVVVPQLESNCAGAKLVLKSLKFWKTNVEVSVYTIANGDIILIADWQKRCASLDDSITSANFPDWWWAVRRCVLQHWKDSPDDYTAAIKRIGVGEAKTYQKHDEAINRIRRALASLVGL